MRNTSLTRQHVMDLASSRRVFNMCWLSAGFGISMLQMMLLAQSWHDNHNALTPACLASVWALGSLLGSRFRGPARLWGSALLACVLCWLVSPALVSWYIPHTVLLPSSLGSVALALLALLLGASSTAWLARQRAWPPAGERAVLARVLVGLTIGLLVAWMLPAYGRLLALACCLPLLALDTLLFRRAPLAQPGSVAARWLNRYWSAGGLALQLERRGLLHVLREPFQSSSFEKARGTLPLSVLASLVVIVLGSVWGAVPTPFAAGLHVSHSLDVLYWLLGGQITALAAGCCCLLAARNGIGFPARLLPLSWQTRMRRLALLMPLAMALSLAALGVPALQARWWLALSLTCYTLADAVWGMLLPRLLPDVTTVVQSQRHLLLPARDARLSTPLHLAYAQVCEARTHLLRTQVEGVAIVAGTPLLGWWIDRLGSVDAVLALVGLACTFSLCCIALAWALIALAGWLVHLHPTPGARGLRVSGPAFSRLDAAVTH